MVIAAAHRVSRGWLVTVPTIPGLVIPVARLCELREVVAETIAEAWGDTDPAAVDATLELVIDLRDPVE